jgi:hypothetical protein
MVMGRQAWSGITVQCSLVEGKLIHSPTELIFYSTVFMNYWAGLNSAADQVIIRQGAENLANVARATQSTERRGNLRIEDAG